jgi:hypothetical protein
MLVQLAGLPAAFAALYQAHDISPDLASALLGRPKRLSLAR